MTVLLTSEDVERLARAHGAAQACGDRNAFASMGWEAFPSTVSDEAVAMLGSTWDPNTPSRRLKSFVEPASSLWSPEAPIALQFHPYNRCELAMPKLQETVPTVHRVRWVLRGEAYSRVAPRVDHARNRRHWTSTRPGGIRGPLMRSQKRRTTSVQLAGAPSHTRFCAA